MPWPRRSPSRTKTDPSHDLALEIERSGPDRSLPKQWLAGLALGLAITILAIALHRDGESFGSLPLLLGATLLPVSPRVKPSGPQTLDNKDNPSAPVTASASTSDLANSTIAEQHRWRLIVDAIPDPAIAIGANQLVLHHNRRSVELFPSVRLGLMFTSVSRHPSLLNTVAEVLVSRKSRTIQFVERVPTRRRISVTVSGLENPGDNAQSFPAVLMVFRDLSTQDNVDQMRADFVANASHELRTPLASLKSYIETLMGHGANDPAARERFLPVMLSQAQRMTQLVSDLLSLSRIEMKVNLPPTDIVDLNEVADEVMLTLTPLAEKRHATISVRKLDRPALIRGDRDEINQVFVNLMQNALKYGGDGVRVQLSITIEDLPTNPGLLVVEVRDNGPGIEAEHLPRLVERFYRVSEKGADKSGTGLGLSIVKHVVLRHRGDLQITSELGKGSSFKVLFNPLGQNPEIERGAQK